VSSTASLPGAETIMSDIKLFKIDGDRVAEIPGRAVAVEKSLQKLIERHLETILSVRFLASEYSTGKAHGGRIDTLGIDENDCPVLIEYKRALNENVINQGLFYLDWLLDHKADFKLLVQQRLGKDAAEVIEWSSPRLICIAGDFTKYDEHAVQQIDKSIELLRYRKYGDGLLLLELVNAVAGESVEIAVEGESKSTGKYKGFEECLAQCSDDLRDRFENLKAFALALGDDVQMKQLKYYVAFRRLRNFASVEVHHQSGQVLMYLKVEPSTIKLEPDFTRDVTKIGHYGTGNLEVRIRSDADLEKAKPLISRSYEES
jgi:predicted transport protein